MVIDTYLTERLVFIVVVLVGEVELRAMLFFSQRVHQTKEGTLDKADPFESKTAFVCVFGCVFGYFLFLTDRILNLG